MSYDLMVFDPEAAPRDHAEFLGWFRSQMECNEYHAYVDPAETTERLQAWYAEMLQTFPSGAGPLDESKPPDYDEDFYSGYSIGREMIYVIFMPSKAEIARRTSFELAAKYELGLFEPTSEVAELWRPQAGKMVLVPSQQEQYADEAPSLWQRLMGKSRGTRLPKPRLPEWMS